MPGSRLLSSLVLSTALAFTVAGCATDTQGESGSLSLDLVINGDTVDQVQWTITRGGEEIKSGTINTSANGATASVEAYGLEPGDGYTITLDATSTDKETTCKGSAMFSIEIGQVTEVHVIMNCKLPPQFGGVRVDGEFNICPYITWADASPLTTSVGNDIDLFAVAMDDEGDPITFMWSSGSGIIANPMADSTTYTCTEVGDDVITILVTDDDGTYCMEMYDFDVTCVAGDGNKCDGVICEDTGNECTAAACNPGTGLCETSNVADGTDCNGGAGMCMGGTCVAKDLCMDVVCEDTGNECTAAVCNPSTGMCETSNVDDGTSCGDGGACMGGTCIEEDLCEGVTCDDTMNDCTVGVCNSQTGTCDVMNVADGTDCDGGAGMCMAGTCVAEDLCMDVVCEDTGNECTAAVCNPSTGMCETSNVADGTDCDGGNGTCNAGACEPNAEVFYEQDFESLDQASGSALADAGFLVFGNEFQPDGTFIQGYGPFSAPNGTPGFCSIALGQGGPTQGAQQLVVYSDYNNRGNQDAGNLVQANTFQEPFPLGSEITNADLGTYEFSFDAKRGDINDSTFPKCTPGDPAYTPNPPCDSTAEAFIKTLDPNAGFATTNNITVDTTNLPVEWARYSLILVVDAALVGQILQFGFAATATNDEPSGVLYDNLLVTKSP